MPDTDALDSLAYIRAHYRVPARVGDRIRFAGTPHSGPVDGRIAGSRGSYLLVDLDPEHPATARRPGRFLLHPTWEVEYLDESGSRTG